jgi:hypothetical protein
VSNRAHENEARAAAQKAEDDKAKAEEQRKADALVEAARKAGLAAPAQAAAAPVPAQPTPPPPYKVTSSDEQRLRNLEVTHSAGSLSDDQKRAAQWEMEAIRDGRDAKMSSSDRARRDSLAQDLGSVDKAKRRQAYDQLGSFYRNLPK